MSTINPSDKPNSGKIKDYPIVLVTWLDAVQHDDDSRLSDALTGKPLEMKSVGFLIKGSIGMDVMLVQTIWDCDEDKFISRSLTIPASWVMGIDILKETVYIESEKVEKKKKSIKKT